MFSEINSMGILGLSAYIVHVESDLSSGMPIFNIVGLPDAAVKESRDRVRSALKNCDFLFPVKHITVNLAPADIRKEGPLYDLPIAVSILEASGQIQNIPEKSVFIGELSLSGEVRPVNGILAMVMKAKEDGYSQIFIPIQNVAEASVIDGISIIPIDNLKNLVDHLIGINIISPVEHTPYKSDHTYSYLDFCQVKGQYSAKRALEVAAAGGHNVILIGPPGSGKSMLAKRIPSILPPMTFKEAIEVTKIHSISGNLPNGVSLLKERPFRSPHHTISPAGLSGGGRIPKPGELSLAHNGVLFLDELPEFTRNALEVLRQPIEDGVVTISRVSGTLTYPCSLMLIVAMNPCPCGYFGHPSRPCTCSASAVSKYMSKVSGPLLDRFDMHVEVASVEFSQLSSAEEPETSEKIRDRVNRAREIQIKRYKKTGITCNANITPDMVKTYLNLSDSAANLIELAFERLNLSARAYDRILKMARTIADLEDSERIESGHMSEAVRYRSLDRKYWLNKF